MIVSNLRTLHCPIKVNLSLHIAHPPVNGYHRLRSWVVFGHGGDVLRIKHTRIKHAHRWNHNTSRHNHLHAKYGEQNILRRSTPRHGLKVVFHRGALGVDKTISNTENTLHKAWRWMLRHQMLGHLVPHCSTRVEVIKNVPVRSGLGAASANAAALMCGVLPKHILRKIHRHPALLNNLALTIGADVPVFLYHALALTQAPYLMEGMGEKITPVYHGSSPIHHGSSPSLSAHPSASINIWPLSWPAPQLCWMIVMKPCGVECHTGEMFTSLAQLRHIHGSSFYGSSFYGGAVDKYTTKQPWDMTSAEPHALNHFVPLLFERYPVLEKLIDALRNHRAIKDHILTMGVSGSGSSIFVLVNPSSDIKAAHPKTQTLAMTLANDTKTLAPWEWVCGGSLI